MPTHRLLLVGLFLLGGCASDPQVVWWRDDFSAEEFADDSALCLNYANAKVESPAGAKVDRNQKQALAKQIYDYCLSSLGYYQVELKDGRLPPPAPPPPDTIDIRFRAPAAPGAYPIDL